MGRNNHYKDWKNANTVAKDANTKLFWNKPLLTQQESKRISVNVFFDHVFKSQFLSLSWVAKPPLKPGLLASFQFSAELRDKYSF